MTSDIAPAPPAVHEAQRSRFGLHLLLALLPGLAFLTLFLVRSSKVVDGVRTFTLFDDALISMSYGRSLALSGDWVWFPGAERVQGFTNPLWSLYMAGLHAVGLNGNSAVLAVSITGIALVLGSAALVGLIVRRSLRGITTSTSPALAAAAITPFMIPLTFWTVRGMEVGLLALASLLLLLGSAALLQGDSTGFERLTAMVIIGAGTVVGAATRLDFAAVVIAVGVVAVILAPNRRTKLMLLLVTAIPLMVTVMAVLAFQKGYWGDLLPNTYRLKAEGFGAADRISRGLATIGKAIPMAAIVTLAAGWAVARGDARARNASVLGASVVAVTVAYSIWVGGDAWEWSGMLNRYVSVAIPAAVAATLIGAAVAVQTPPSRRALAVLGVVPIAGLAYGLTSNPVTLNRAIAVGLFVMLAIGCALVALTLRRAATRTSSRSRTWVVASVSGLLLIAVSVVPGYLWARGQLLFIDTDQEVVAASKLLAEVTDPTAVIATAWGGAPAYYSERPMIDLLGKSDRVIAGTSPKRELYPGHDKWDYQHSIRDLRPDVVRELFLEGQNDIDNLASWGYVIRCFGDQRAYFLEGSSRVRWEVLRSCQA